MLSDLAFALAENQEFEIHVVTSRQRYDDAMAALSTEEKIRGVSIHRVWTSRFGRQNLLGRAIDYASFYVTAFVALMRLADEFSLIVAKTDPPLISVVAALVARIKSAKLVNWIQDLFPEVAAALGVKFVRGPLYDLLKALRNSSLRSAKINVVIGELMKQKLIDVGISEDHIRVIHNWADGHIRPVPPEENSLRKEWGLDGKFVVGYSGNLGRSHDFKTILDTATALNYRDDIIFLFVGGGANLRWVEHETKQRGLRNIRFKPYQPRERLSESLSAADVHLITLRPELEGLIVPSKFYGIAAAGRPILYIGSRAGDLPQTITRRGLGYVVTEGDSSTFQNQIIEIAENHKLRLGMGKNARDQLDRLYNRMIARKAWQSLLLEQ